MANDFYIPPRRKTRIAAVDLDGTLAYSTWEPGQKRSVVGDPIPANISKLNDLVEAGDRIWIHTSRHWSDHEMIEEWCRVYNVPFERIICGKLLADKYIDDKAVDARSERWL